MHVKSRKSRRAAAACSAFFVTTGLCGAASADAEPRVFNHVGTFTVPANLPAADPYTTVTSAEIVDVSKDGKTLIYTDSPAERLGFIDIRDAHAPQPAGVIDLDGEPTSVAVRGRYALVAVNTSASFTEPSGSLLVIDIQTRRLERSFALLGQPDSVAVSPDGGFAAIVIENERDEDLNDGLLPQLPAGALQVLRTRGNPNKWTLTSVHLTGIADVAPSDPEPEFVDINRNNLAVVTLQENNHLVIVDLERGRVVNDFSAGSVTVTDVDATEEKLGPQAQGLIELTETLTRRREPDAVAWVDDDTFATANEGDYEDADGVEGGSRGFTLFNVDGTVEFESGSSFEHLVVSAGHFPEARAANKGNEPEGIEVARFGRQTLLFVGSERANVVGVYDVSEGQPRFLQLLPTGIGPEGIKAIPERKLLAVSAETDGLDDGFDIRSIVTLYALERGPLAYPQLQSEFVDGLPIPWVAISGLAADPHDADTVYAVSDSFLAQAYLYVIAAGDLRQGPGRIVRRIPVGAPDGLLDLEGVVVRAEGGFWLASEGRVGDRPNAVLRVDEDGVVLQTVLLPDALAAQATSSGFEGVAVVGSSAGNDETLYVAIQREWKDDDKGFVKIGRYDVANAQWSFALYPLDAVESPNGGWVGLSEVTALADGRLAIVERDNQIGLDARIKRLYVIDPTVETFQPYGASLAAISKSLAVDLLPALDAHSISVPDKVEGVAVTVDGRVLVSTDNDGVDENYGETLFFDLAGGTTHFE